MSISIRPVNRPGVAAALVILMLASACGGKSGATSGVAGGDAPSSHTPEKTVMTTTAAGFYALQTHTLDGQPADLATYQGKVSLVVNVASECGLTPQYAGLQALHAELSAGDFQVLAFPSNDFGGQEPGSPEQIQNFCSSEYAVSFPMFEKVMTKAGEGQSPVYTQLQSMTGELPSWNFSKYVVSKDGARVTFFGPKTEPDDPALRAKIEEELAL